MDRNLLIRFLRTALISSPIIALYGVTPFYVFNTVQPLFIGVTGLVIALNVFIFWIINISIVRHTGTEKKWKWYVLSYASIVTFHILLILLRHALPTPSFISEGELSFRRHILIIFPAVSMLAINTIILIICNSILATQKHRDAEMEIQELRVSNLEAQKQVLLQQLQPHFLFNALSVLKSLIKEEPDEAEDYAIKLSEFLRYSLEVHKSDLVSVEQELKFTNDYIDLQKVRFGCAVNFDVNIPRDAYKLMMPAYALQTLVENAIKHNVFTERRPLQIRISYVEGNAVVVSNNKVLTKVAENTGTGLSNLNQRYKLITNREIEVNDSRDGFSVKVQLINAHNI